MPDSTDSLKAESDEKWQKALEAVLTLQQELGMQQYNKMQRVLMAGDVDSIIARAREEIRELSASTPNTGQCPPGTVWDEKTGRCVLI